MTQTKQKVTSYREYVPHCERFELKIGMRGEEGLLTNFPKFHGGCATSSTGQILSNICNKALLSLETILH